MAQWQATAHTLAQALGGSDPKRRLPWFGPDMGVQMFTTARYMEVWAHAQEVYDLVGASRRHTDRIKNVATIGTKTFGWTFVNRKLEVPGPPPYVRLVANAENVWVPTVEVSIAEPTGTVPSHVSMPDSPSAQVKSARTTSSRSKNAPSTGVVMVADGAVVSSTTV